MFRTSSSVPSDSNRQELSKGFSGQDGRWSPNGLPYTPFDLHLVASLAMLLAGSLGTSV